MSKLNVRKGLSKGSKKKAQEKDENFFNEVFSDFVDDRPDEVQEVKSKPKSFAETPLGKILHAIKVTKNENLLDDESIEKDFNSYIVIKFLSMNEDNCDILEMIDEFQTVLSKKEFFKLLVNVIPRGKTFDKFVNPKKATDDALIEYIARYYQIGLREARLYFQTLGSEWAQGIKNKFGGFQK